MQLWAAPAAGPLPLPSIAFPSPLRVAVSPLAPLPSCRAPQGRAGAGRPAHPHPHPAAQPALAGSGAGAPGRRPRRAARQGRGAGGRQPAQAGVCPMLGQPLGGEERHLHREAGSTTRSPAQDTSRNNRRRKEPHPPLHDESLAHLRATKFREGSSLARRALGKARQGTCSKTVASNTKCAIFIKHLELTDNGPDMKQELQIHHTAVSYRWKPGCKRHEPQGCRESAGGSQQY